MSIGKGIKDMVGRDIFRDLTADVHLHLSLTLASTYGRHQALFKDEKLLTMEADNCPETSASTV